MKRIVSLVALTTVASFAFDQYLPVAPKTLEVDLGYSYVSMSGYYDMDGKKQDFKSFDPAGQSPNLALKYGIMPGLDAELALGYVIMNEDAGDTKGLDRPQLAVKYVAPDLGAGAFVNVVLPVGSSDIVGDKPATTFVLGAIYGKGFDQLKLNAFASYEFNTEVEKWKQDALLFFAQGQFDVTPMVGPYLAVQFDKDFEAKYDGKSIKDSDGYLLTLRPGANFVINEMLSAEANVPVTVMGKNSGSYWGLNLGLYYSLGL